ATHRLRVVAATMDAVLQVAQALVETLAVRFPGDPIHPGRRALSKAEIRPLEQRHPEVAEQVGPLLLWLRGGSLSYPLQDRGRVLFALCRGRVSCSGIPLGLGPSLHRLEGRYPHLRRLRRYYGLV